MHAHMYINPSTESLPSLYFWVYHGGITVLSTLKWPVILHLKTFLTKWSMIWNFLKKKQEAEYIDWLKLESSKSLARGVWEAW